MCSACVVGKSALSLVEIGLTDLQKIGGEPPQTLSSNSPEARARMDKERDNLVCLS